MTRKPLTVGFPHRPASTGGPGSFQERLTGALEALGWRPVYPDDGVLPDVVLVIAGTRRLAWLRRCKRQGSRIIHRLDGINWRHRVVWPGLRVALKASAANRLMAGIRDRLADQVVYQSEFVRAWWHTRFGPATCPERVIHNAVPLDAYRPAPERGADQPNVVILEGNVPDDAPTRALLWAVSDGLVATGEVAQASVIGGLPPRLQRDLSRHTQLTLVGEVPRADVPRLLHSDAILISVEINPSCPNSVIEAMAAGLPIVAFDTGSLRELVAEESGVLVPYGADPWALEVPDVPALIGAVRDAMARRAELGANARARAEAHFGMDRVVEEYVATCHAAREGR